MTDKTHNPDIWDILSTQLWMLILLMGFFPEAVFYVLRELGHVTTRQAFVNNPWFISLACAGFLGWFTYQRCREYEEREDIAIGKGVQVTIIALAAFLPLAVERFPAYLYIPIPRYRNLILAIIAGKMASWIYLVQLVMRYYLTAGPEVFKKMPLVFPSMRRAGKATAPAPPDSPNATEATEESD